jgi:hypothetical protein
MARFLQDRSCNDDFVPIARAGTGNDIISDNDMDVEGEPVEDNIEEIIINIYANDEMEVDEYVIQENKKRKREEEDEEDDEDEDKDKEEEEEEEEEEEDLMYEEEEGDVYQHVALLEAENEDLRQQLANANNVVPSRIQFPDGYHIGFEYVNGVRYLFVYQQPVNNSPLSLADLQDDEDEDDDEDDEDEVEVEDEVLSIINPDDIIKEKESDDEDDDEMDMSK